MEKIAQAGVSVRKLALLALLGFGILVFIGPMTVFLALAIVVVNIAFLGLLIWLPIQVLFLRRESTVNQLRGFGDQFVKSCNNLGRISSKAIAVPARIGKIVGQTALALTWKTLKTTGLVLRITAEMTAMAITGAIVGGLWGVAHVHGEKEPLMVIASDTVVGIVIASLVALGLIFRERFKR